LATIRANAQRYNGRITRDDLILFDVFLVFFEFSLKFLLVFCLVYEQPIQDRSIRNLGRFDIADGVEVSTL
jgi:hypothetical protein